MCAKLMLQFRPAMAGQNTNTKSVAQLQCRNFYIGQIAVSSIEYHLRRNTPLLFTDTPLQAQCSGASLLQWKVSFAPGANWQRYMRRCRKSIALVAR